ncbi:MAG TPA: pyruvate dehydrogenase complex dihydrolipoamide acetyltransferase [Kofleriaceae bacterium]|nr:pyruvate dehydrogenase complex dihydrolipoamide acetyltransferase [Kofleriaceae bacterium]
MAQIIGLPKLSPTMEEGVLVKWAKKEGDSVEPGDLVAEVETDKANMDFNLEDEGTLLKLLVAEGDTVKLGAPVAILGETGEDIAALIAEAQAQGNGQPAAAPSPAPAPTPAKAPTPTPAKAAVKPAVAKAPAPAPAPAPAAPTPSAGGRLLASPLAKTLALELGVDLRAVQGSGPGGRIVERDVRALAGAKGAPEPAAVEAPAANALAVVARGPVAVPGKSDEYVDRPLSTMRKRIAERLTAAKRDIPHFYLTASCDAGPLLAFRARLNQLLGGSGKVSVNDLIIKGCALALRRVPEVNAAFMGDAIRYFTHVHMGVAVAIEDGLVTPVVRDADLKGIGVISAEVKDLADRAKHRGLKMHEIQGSTFTVSNLGMFGIDVFQAIINPPEGAVLAVGRIRKQPVVAANGTITASDRMSLTLSCDHRTVDGALGARYLDELTDLLEHPESLAL